MTTEQKKEQATPGCPLLGLWNAYNNSDAARHTRGMQREALLLVRSVLDAAIRKTEEQLAGQKSNE